MRFDTADVANMILNNTLNTVILHEMGHVLGFSAGFFNWSFAGVTRNCMQLESTPDLVSPTLLDTHFMCTDAGSPNDAVAAFDSLGGTSYTGGNKVPLENCVTGTPPSCSQGSGSINSHWRESVFDNELMTGYADAVNIFSLLTIATMGDLGYQVNFGAAQTYSRVFTAPRAVAAGTGGIWLGNDELVDRDLRVLDRSGRVIGRVRR